MKINNEHSGTVNGSSLSLEKRRDRLIFGDSPSILYRNWIYAQSFPAKSIFTGKLRSDHSQKTRLNHFGGEKCPKIIRDSPSNPF